MIVRARQEHDVSRHHRWSTANHENLALVELPTKQRDQNGEEGTDDIRWDGVELLRDGGGCGVDGLDDGGCEKG